MLYYLIANVKYFKCMFIWQMQDIEQHSVLQCIQLHFNTYVYHIVKWLCNRVVNVCCYYLRNIAG